MVEEDSEERKLFYCLIGDLVISNYYLYMMKPLSNGTKGHIMYTKGIYLGLSSGICLEGYILIIRIGSLIGPYLFMDYSSKSWPRTEPTKWRDLYYLSP
jgi:hypothetical protein